MTTQVQEKATGEIAIIDTAFSFEPRTLEEAMKYADLIAKSNLVPPAFKDKPADILVAMQMGMEVGLKPLAAIQNIAVINGKPTLYGDAMLGVVQASGTMDLLEETWDDATKKATFKARRKGQQGIIVRTFSYEDAKLAGLLDKVGPWKSYPKRMCQMRARGFGLRDGWADKLKGLNMAEEAMDFIDAKTVHVEEIKEPEAIKESAATPVQDTNGHKPEPEPTPTTTVAEMDYVGLEEMSARFEGKCGHCGDKIEKGSAIFYDRPGKIAYHRPPCHVPN